MGTASKMLTVALKHGFSLVRVPGLVISVIFRQPATADRWVVPNARSRRLLGS